MHMKKCGACGTLGETDTTECVVYKYKGSELSLPDIKGHHCKSCGEVTMDGKVGDKYLSQTKIFKNVIDVILKGK